MRFLNKLDRSIAVELVLRLIDDVFRFPEGVDIDDHDFDAAGRGKPPHIGETRTVVDEITAGHPVVTERKMLLRDLERLAHAFPDGNGRDHDDEF